MYFLIKQVKGTRNKAKSKKPVITQPSNAIGTQMTRMIMISADNRETLSL
jgi:hypothetical protein